MELHEIIQDKFGSLDKSALRVVVEALSPCEDGLGWFDENWPVPFTDVPISWLSWFARPFLRRANLRDANLRDADLHDADLRRAYLRRANLHAAYLYGANLRDGDLRRADLSDADLRDADLRRAYLYGADLSGAKWDDLTVWPAGFNDAGRVTWADIALANEVRDLRSEIESLKAAPAPLALHAEGPMDLNDETVEGALARVGEVLPTLPNGVKIFNSTPHPIRFWDESWPEPVEVPSHIVINAEPAEVDAGKGPGGVKLVKTEFNRTGSGRITLSAIPDDVVVIGSFIAAQAYPGRIVAMCPCDGYERVAPADKRMRPDKFTTF